jgi:hypothetical protein
MEKHEQRFVIKFLWMRGLASSAIYQELPNTLGSTAYSEDSVENWVQRFVSGDTSCGDFRRVERPRTDASEPLRKFFHDFPFATARMMSRQFKAHPTTIKEILRPDLGLKKIREKMASTSPESLSKSSESKAAKLRLPMFRMLQPNAFDGIVTGDESWFQ